MKKRETLQVILKVVERCNLACSYCYYFEGGDRTFASKPAVISMHVIRDLCQFLSKGAEDLGLRAIAVVFHGGEPMMLKPKLFDEICTSLRGAINGDVKLYLGMQTNGTHLNNEWCSHFTKHNVQVSVSIDGMAAEHDKFRKFHNGRGSFEVVKKNYRKLKELAAKDGRSINVISVLSAGNDYRKIINELHLELGVENFNFLLPDCNHDDGIPDGYSARDYGRTLCDIFDMWEELGSVYIREIDNLLRRFQLAVENSNKDTVRGSDVDLRSAVNQIIVVRSDGELQIDDTFIPASNWRNRLPKRDISKIGLKEYLSLPVFEEIDHYQKNAPDKCVTCVWRNICNGGDLENRWSDLRGFNNPSVYCEGLRMLYRRVAYFLRRNGYPKAILRARLNPDGLANYTFAK